MENNNRINMLDDPDGDAVASSHNNRPVPVPFILRILRQLFRLGCLIAPKMTSQIATNMWFTPPRYKTPVAERGYMQNARLELLSLDGHSITTYCWGESGPMVLLVHGWSGRGTQLGAFAQPLVDAGFRVVSFDAPAHGSSSGKQTNLFEVSAVIMALAKHYGGFHSVVTHSFGGMCIAYACSKGFSCERIAMICPPVSASQLVDKFAAALRISDKCREIMKHIIVNRFEDFEWGRFNVANNVHSLTIPGLVVHDENDVDIPWHEGQAIAQAWPGAEFIHTTSLGHRRILRDDKVIARVVSFIGRKEAKQDASSPNFEIADL